MTALSNNTLATLDSHVEIPSYDRSAIRPGIIHIGVGGFHRAHQAMYVDELMRQGKAHEWGICGLGLLPHDEQMRDALTSQDSLYTLVVKHADGELTARVIGSIVDYLYAPDDPEAALEQMADPAIKIVSLTVTEGGYNVNQVTREFDFETPAIQADLKDGATPTTHFGYIVEALRRRRSRGIAPFTIMSCDNIPGNGDNARNMFTAFARAKDSELADWIEANVPFPNSMVDRITPRTTDADRSLVADRYGIEDAWPVVTEPFTQWVLEDSFTSGRPPYEEAGVQVVTDVEPYELMKLRLLNVSHQGIAYLGHLAGYRLAHDVAQDPLFATFLRSYMDNEATPTLPPIPGVDLDEYKTTLIQRFSNAYIKDTVARLCAESSDRIPNWLVPVIKANIASSGNLSHSALIVASWARYAEGVDEQGEPIEIVDRIADKVHAAALAQAEDDLAFIRDRDLFGDLVDDERFVACYRWALASLHERGAVATIKGLLDGEAPHA